MISLEEVKAYLRVEIDNTDDDILLDSLIKSVEAYIDSCCGIAYKTDDSKVELAKLLIKKLVKDEYDNRGTYKETKFKRDRITDTILELLANAGDVNE